MRAKMKAIMKGFVKLEGTAVSRSFHNKTLAK